MKRRIKTLLRLGAPVALGLFSATGFAASYEPTLPANPDDRQAYEEICRAFRDNFAESPLLMENFINHFPASLYAPDVRLMQADWWFFKEQYPLALQYYNELPDKAFSGNVRERMLYRKAFCLVKTGYYREAEKLFSSLLGSQEFGNPSRYYLAYLRYVDGDYDEAYKAFTKLLNVPYRELEAEYYLNQIDFKRGEYQKVARTSERLLTPDIPDQLLPETMRVGGISFFKIGDKTTARNILSRYVDLLGGGAEISALYTLGSIHYDDGNYKEALPLFTSVTDYPGPLAQSAWLYIGQIHMKNGDAEAAALAFDKAAGENWDDGVTQAAAYNLAVSSTRGSSLPFSDAAKAMENFVDTYPNSPYSTKLTTYLANAYYGKRNYEEALRQVDRLTHPDASTNAMRQKILYQLGVKRLQQNKLNEAIGYLKDASNPSSPDKTVAAQAEIWLGDAYYEKKDYQASAKAYEQALASGNAGVNTALANYNLGYAYMKMKNYSKAETAFGKAISNKGLAANQLTDAELRRADCLYYTGKYSDALALFRKVKKKGGQSGAFAAIREADILGRDGDLTQKTVILEGVVNDPDAGIWRTTAMNRLADAYSEKGEDRKAAELYARILKNSDKDSDNSQTYFSLATNAENLYQAGDLDGAYQAYKLVEESGIDALYPLVVTGIMRTSKDNEEIMEYAETVTSIPGLTSEGNDEALYRGAMAMLQLENGDVEKAKANLNALAGSSDRLWGARAAVKLAELQLEEGNAEEAEKTLLAMIDAGSEEPYWLARGYISLADVYILQGKDYLAKLYLENLRSNYPGSEKEISDMISKRLKNLKK